VVISEVMPSSGYSIVNGEGSQADWIELYNTGKKAAVLDGAFLSDDPVNRTKWQIPALTIEPGQRALIRCAGATAKEGEDAEAVETAKAAVIESCREKLDEIYGRIENGESFETLIAEYNTDPGMSGDNLKNGYAVHAETVVFMQEFTDGAFSGKMQKVGDVSDPVVTSYGVHILYYLKDIPGGAIEYTEEVKAAIVEYCVGIEQDALLRQWLSDYGVEYTAEYAEMMG
jgi:hypothetical protein